MEQIVHALRGYVVPATAPIGPIKPAVDLDAGTIKDERTKLKLVTDGRRDARCVGGTDVAIRSGVRPRSNLFLSPPRKRGGGGGTVGKTDGWVERRVLPWIPAPELLSKGAGKANRIIATTFFVLAASTVAHAEDHIRFSYVVPTIDYTPLLVAIDDGYFTQEGIAVELVQAQGGIATPALISGDLDFSGSSSAAISAVLEGAHLKVLTTGEDRSTCELWARPDIKSLEELKGQQVGVISRGDTTEIQPARYVHWRSARTCTTISSRTSAARRDRRAHRCALTSGTFPAAVIDGGGSSTTSTRCGNPASCTC